MATTGTITVQAMIEGALIRANILAASDQIRGDDLQDAMKVLDDMLKAIQPNGVTIWQQTSGSITVTNATASYTISARPLNLDVVNWKTSDGIESPMLKLTRKEYYELPDKDSAGRPSQYYYDRQREQGVLYVWPVLATADSQTIEWIGTGEMSDITDSTATLEIPGEWREAIVYQLASRLQDEYGRVNPRIDARAAEALAYAQGFDRESVYFQPEQY